MKAALIEFPRICMFAQQFQPEQKQIIKIHYIAGALAGSESILDRLNLCGERLKILVLLFEDLLDWLLLVDRH